MDNSQEKSLCTPRRAQKCLFAPSSGKSSGKSNGKFGKRDASQDSECRDDKSSGEESDLGPMSPLALTQSPSVSDLSSPGREFISPFATPEKSPRRNTTSWDRLRLSCTKDPGMSPFTSLKKVVRAARYSPRCKLFSGSYSPKSLPSTPDKLTDPATPQRIKLWTVAEQSNDIVPETPQRNFATEIQNQDITETPRKGRTPESKQMTPLNSISKAVPLPRLHRRKSFSAIETIEGLSPEQKENTLKRHARDQSAAKPTKLFKADEGFVPRARASLFQEKTRRDETGSSLSGFSLSTTTFYSGNSAMRFERSFGNFNKSSDAKKRRSLPSQGNAGRRSLMIKRRRSGKINAGVCHSIKKPRPKVNTDIVKEQQQIIAQSPTRALSKSPPGQEARPMEVNAEVRTERASSPMVDETKRFFKTNRTIRSMHAVTVTVNNKIKLKVADGKIALKENRSQKSAHNPSTSVYEREPRNVTNDVTLDATDLTVDEPEIEATLQQDKVTDLLKILENDWANDDYDTMGPLTHIANAFSPLKLPTTLPNDAIMSPATELSNMTSTMNIKDVAPLRSFGNLSLDSTNNNNDTAEKETAQEDTEKRYFPLFKKGYSVPDDIFQETNNANPIKAAKRNTQWQLSTKGGMANSQYQLDVGQKHFGATQCPECNIVYQLGDPEDENAHLNYHNSVRTLKFQGWKNERIILEDPFTSSRIILVEPHDSKQHWKKVLEILTVVDRDLGLADINSSDYQNKKILLYIREKNVLGVLVAEHIETAFRMIPELIDLNCCTAESTPTKCGINVVWTAMSHRKQGIATKLVDILRAKFFYGYVMSLDDIAFSIPTPSGKTFAEKYTKTKNFKVYN